MVLPSCSCLAYFQKYGFPQLFLFIVQRRFKHTELNFKLMNIGSVVGPCLAVGQRSTEYVLFSCLAQYQKNGLPQELFLVLVYFV